MWSRGRNQFTESLAHDYKALSGQRVTTRSDPLANVVSERIAHSEPQPQTKHTVTQAVVVPRRCHVCGRAMRDPHRSEAAELPAESNLNSPPSETNLQLAARAAVPQ